MDRPEIVVAFVSPGSVNTAVECLRIGTKLNRFRETARMMLEPWVVEAALARFAEKRPIPEQLKLGFEIAESTVSKYMIRHREPPSQSWRTFLRNHADAIAAIDLCVVPTLTFECLFAFVVMGHGRRQLLWFAVTRHPTAEWLAQQILEAFPWNTAPTYLVRDNDGAYGQAFTSRVRAIGIRDRPIAPRSPWQNGHAERLIGSIRRDCLDHVVVFGERHLRHLLGSYQKYYNDARTHLSLDKDAPASRAVQAVGRIVPTPHLGGLHHQYVRI